MLFIHVITRLNRFIEFTPFDGLFRVGFQIKPQRMLVDVREQEHFPEDAKHQDLFVEGKILRNLTGLLQAIVAYVLKIHIERKMVG